MEMEGVEWLRGVDSALAGAYESLFTAHGDALPAVERALILFGARSVFGPERLVADEGRAAVQLGASFHALVEVVLTAALSRGPGAFTRALPFLESLPRDHDEPAALRCRPVEPLEYFGAQFGELPAWVLGLHHSAPATLASYASLRDCILAEGAVPRKTKELLTMLLNAVTANTTGIQSHARGALRWGATRDEVLQTLLLGIPLGGIVAWINGVQALGDELASPRAP